MSKFIKRILELEEDNTDLRAKIERMSSRGIEDMQDRIAEIEAELAYIEEPKYCKSCKSRCVFEGYEAGLLVFVCIECGDKLWYNASNETITLPEPATFLPDCKWQRKVSSVTYCTNLHSVNFDKSCDKNCANPEPKENSNE